LFDSFRESDAGTIEAGSKTMKRQAKTVTRPIRRFAQSSNGDTVDSVTLDLLANWRRQDATDNPHDIRVAEQEVAEFKKAMNDNRVLAGQPPVFP
jgi:hypothetical protein